MPLQPLELLFLILKLIFLIALFKKSFIARPTARERGKDKEFGATTIGLMTIKITALSITPLSKTNSTPDTQYKDTQHIAFSKITSAYDD
jgi:hypothetical protein